MLVYLNGTSSSGKTSIARDLQKLIQGPYFYYSIDTLLYSLSQEDLDAVMGKRPYRQQLDWDAIFEGYFASVAALSTYGNNIIADCPIYSEKLGDFFSKHLDSIHGKLIVKVECPLTVLESREKIRGDRALGIARGQFEGIHKHLNFDIEVNSSKCSSTEIASLIFRNISEL